MKSLSPPARRRLVRAIRPACALGLVVLTALVLQVSWLRWMDPFIDFGREVYMPWRILAGEHPGRDFVHLYGPLSVYLNAGLFSLFGTSILTLVVANLAVFAGVAAGLFVVVRRAFGFTAAAVVVAVSVPVYGFSHYDGINNYTYAAPYAHEATHGMLLLLLVLVWLGRPGGAAFRPDRSVVTGALLGLCCLTKTEYVLVAGLLWLACLVRVARAPGHPGNVLRWVAGSVAGGGVVGLAAWGTLCLALKPIEAARLAANAVLAPFSYRALAESTLGRALLGADRLGENLLALVLVGGAAVVILAGVALLFRRTDREPGKTRRNLLVACTAAGVAVAVAWIPWLSSATAFPALLAAGLAWLGWCRGISPTFKGPWSTRGWARMLLAVAGVGMLARMAFAPTLDHYGFFQALLAGAWVIGFVVGEWPAVATSRRRLRWVLTALMVLLVAGASGRLWARSVIHYRAKSFTMGEGKDRIRSYAPDAYGLPAAFEQVRAYLAAHPTPARTLVVVPEGLLMNYWTRHRHPLRIFDLLPATLALNRRNVLEDLATAAPDTVVLVSRDMIEFGHAAYGADVASGKPILDWIHAHYTRIGHVGDYPFQRGKLGVWLLRRNDLVARAP